MIARPIFDARRSGTRAATKVRVRSPHGSAYDGCSGLISRDLGHTVLVRLDSPTPYLVELPFALSELVRA